MSENLRQPIVVTMLLRVQLCNKHINLYYIKAVPKELQWIEKALREEHTKKFGAQQAGTENLVPVTAIIVRAFAAMLRSNTLLMSIDTTYLERKAYKAELLKIRRVF